MADTLTVRVEFTGGLEQLFSNQRSHVVHIPSLVPVAATTQEDDAAARTRQADVAYLIEHLRTRLLKRRPELFIDNGTV